MTHPNSLYRLNGISLRSVQTKKRSRENTYKLHHPVVLKLHRHLKIELIHLFSLYHTLASLVERRID